MKLLRGVLTAGLIAVSVTAALLAVTLYTQSGLRWTAAALQTALAGALEIDGLQGRLAGPLTIIGLEYRGAGVRVRVSRLALDWQPGRLLQGRLQVSALRAAEVEVITGPAPDAEAEPERGPLALPDVRLPLAVEIEEASLDTLTVRGAGDSQPFTAVDIRTALRFDAGLLAVRRFEASTPELSLAAHGELSPTGDYPLAIDARYALRPAGLPPLTGTLTAAGSLARLRLEHRTLSPVKSRLAATLSAVLTDPAWEARLEVAQFDTRAVDPDWEPITARAVVQSRGSLEHYTFELEAELAGERIPEGSWTLTGSGGPRRVEVERLRGETEAGTVTARLQVADWLSTPRWTASLDIDQLDTSRLDPSLEALTVSGSAHSEGTLESYRFAAQARIQGTRVPSGSWSLAGSGTAQGLEIETLRGETLGGTVSGTVAVQVAPHLQWRLSGAATAIDPALFWPDWPGQLDFRLRGNGGQQQARYHAQLELIELSGTLRQQPVSASGLIGADQQGWRISGLQASAAEAHLSANGTLTDRWSLEWDLAAPDLAAVYPQAQGSLTGSGALSGPRAAPHIRMQLRGERLAFGEYRAADLRLALDWSADDSQASRLELSARDLVVDGQPVRRVAVDGQGPASAHRIRLSIDAQALQLSGDVTGSYSERAWQGLLRSAALTLPPTGDWLLEEPARLELSQRAAQLSSLCLGHREHGQACFEGSWSQTAGWRAALRAEQLPLALLSPLLPAQTGVEGRLRVSARAQQQPAGPPQGELEITSAAGTLLYTPPDQQQVALGYRDLRLTGDLEEGIARLATSAQLGQSGRLDGRMRLPLPGFAAPSQRIEGALSARLAELGILRALLPQVGAIRGQLAADLTAGGTLQTPALDLDLALADGEVVLPEQGLTLEGISLHAEADRSGEIPFRAQARSGEGGLEVKGRFSPGRERAWRVSMAVEGSRFVIMDVPEYRVLVSPDLEVEMRADAARVTGEVLIPEARLRPKQRSGATRPSSDVVIVTQEQQKGGGYPVDSRVRFELGERVRFDGYGLKGQLTGSVVVTDAPNRLTSGTGEVRIEQGSYKAYGQNLKIERGRLILVGGPLDNPGLDIRAVREVGEVTAGLHITGELREPEVSVYSTPPMSDTEALSYLVLGRPLPQDDTAEREKLNSASAALALGVGGASLLGEKLGEQMGIDELGLETESSTGAVTLKLGTYVTPDLFVGYGRGLANDINSFLIRYRLTKRLSVESESSAEAVGGDIFYSIER